MAYNQYGTFNPAALEPYPIETELAKQATEGSGATAGTLLDQYWLERQANKNLYGQELDAQHEQARQQIAAQMADARYKALSELGKTPGGWELAAGSPELSQIFGGSTSLPAVIDIQRRAQQATNLEKAGSGAKSLVEGGYEPNIGDLQNVTQTNLQKVTPLSTINAQIAAAARMKAAGMQAAQANQPTFTMPVPGMEGGTISTHLNPNQAPSDQVQVWGQVMRQIERNQASAVPPPEAPITPPPVPKKIGMSTTGTNLPPMAKRDTGGAPAPSVPTGHSYVDTATPQGKVDQVRTIQFIDKLKTANSQAYADLSPKGRGTPTMPLAKNNTTGQLYVQGKSGNYYEVQ